MSGAPFDVTEETGWVPAAVRFFVLLLVLAPAVLTAGFHFHPEYIGSLKTLAYIITAGGFFLLVSYRSRRSVHSLVLLFTVLAVPTIGAIALLAGPYGRTGLHELALVTSYLFVFLGAARSDALRTRRFPRYLLVAALPVLALAITQMFLDDSPLTTGTHSPHRYGTMLHPYQLNGFLLFSLPFLIWLARDGRRQITRLLSLLAALSGLTLLVWQNALIAVITLLTGLLTAGFLNVLRNRRNATEGTSCSPGPTGVFVGWFALIVGGLVFVPVTVSPASFAELSRPLLETASHPDRREATLQIAGHAYRRSVPFGTGPGTFPRNLKSHQADVLRQERFRTVTDPSPRVGNQYLSMLAEYGISGFLALIALLTFGLRMQIAEMHRQTGVNARFFAAGTAALMAFVLYGLVHDGYSDPVTAGLLVLYLGFLVNRAPYDTDQRTVAEPLVAPFSRPWTWGLGSLLVAGLVFVSARRTIGGYHLERGTQLLHPRSSANASASRSARNRRGIRHLRQSVRYDPSGVDARIELMRQFNRGVLGTVFSRDRAAQLFRDQVRALRRIAPSDERLYVQRAIRAKNRYQNESGGNRWYKRALRNYRKAVDLHPNHLKAYRDLAWLVAKRDRTRAIGYYEEVLKIKPDHRETHRNLLVLRISLLKEQKKYQTALDILRKTLRKHPDDPTLRQIIQMQIKSIRTRMSNDGTDGSSEN